MQSWRVPSLGASTRIDASRWSNFTKEIFRPLSGGSRRGRDAQSAATLYLDRLHNGQCNSGYMRPVRGGSLAILTHAHLIILSRASRMLKLPKTWHSRNPPISLKS
ncbi:Protoporphyrin uptake protein 1 [Fusarium oxysporum f. sp. albedinis]|nr:Protoporphyrin uptake protein 1 [Fusarium oxysporum f. sp. albedinis]